MATYYVSTSGSNSNNGTTQSTPWLTPQWAADHATAAGDIIALKKGDTFLVNNVIEITHGGSAGNIITWDGSLWGTGVNAIVRANVDGGNAPVWYSFVHIAACQYVTLQNITFDGNAKNRFGIVIGGDHSTYGATHQNNEAYITIQNCEILNFGRGSYYCLALTAQTWNNGMSNITFRGNTVNGCGAEAVGSYCGRSDEGSPPATPAQNNNLYIGYNTISNFGRSGSLGEGIQINSKTTNAIVEHNIITDGPSGTGVGMAIEHNEPNAGYFPTGLIVRYNKITMTKQNSWCLMIQQGEAITADIYSNIFINENTSNGTASSGGGGLVVWVNYTRPYVGSILNFNNNTFYVKSGNCIYSECNTNGALRLKNNIFYNQAPAGASACFLDYFGYATHSNNLYYRSAGASELKVQYSSSYYYTTANVQGWEATAEVGDPLFTAIGTDFHIGPGSPATDQGVVISPPIPYDYAGATWGNPPSIGAYEHGIGSIYYVSTSGNNNNNGLTTSTPWQTLQWAESHATSPGDTIALKKGDNWATNLALGITHGGAVGNPIVWDGGLWGTGANAVISPTGNRPDGQVALISIAGCKNVTIQNITCDGNGRDCEGIVIGGGSDRVYGPNAVQNDEKYIIIQDCSIINIGTASTNYALAMIIQTWNNDMSDITIRRNSINGAANWGIAGYQGRAEYGAVPSRCSNMYIGYNTITRCGLNGDGRGAAIGLTQDVFNCIVEHNIITQGVGGQVMGMVQAGEDGKYPTGTIWRYNDVRMESEPCFVISNGDAQTADIYCNKFYLNNATGKGTVMIFPADPPYTGGKFNFWNNTVVADTGGGFDDGTGVPNVTTWTNNILYDNSHTTNPLFVNKAGFDYHLQSTSPYRSNGVNVPSVPIDFDGIAFATPRSQGAFQYALGAPTAPSVVTTSVTGILQTTATGNGNITSNGGSAITVSGVCWGTTIDPTTSNSKTIDGPTSGTFSSSIVGLSPGTIYYLRAYATNAIGTSYGVSIQFVTSTTVVAPVVVTNTVTNISYTSALVSVTVSSLGGETPGNFFGGVLVSTTPNPTYPSQFFSGNANNLGTFTSTTTGLTANTLYYYRAYGINTAGTAYGAQLTFTTLSYVAPTVTTTPISNITATTASSGGGIINNGGQVATSKGVCWSTTPTPTIANTHTTDGSGDGNWSSSITGLTFNTTYYVRAYSTNSAGTGYGNQLSFTTASVIPTLLTNNITSITTTTAVSGGNTLNDNGSSITGKGVCWSTSPTPTIADNHTHDGSGTGNYSSLLSGLIEDTDYYVRAYATNSIGTGYGPENGFKTQTIQEQTVVQNATVHKWFVWPSGSDYGALYNWYAVNSGNSIKYGYLYNWYAATDVRNIANTGWHVPTYAQFDIMRTYLGGFLLAGGPLKETGLTYWDSPNTGATNSSGFSARGSGIRFVVSGLFGDIKQDMTLMLADSFDLTQSLSADIVYQNATFFDGITKKGNGLSIRLMKDSTILTNGQTGTYTGNDGKVYNTICIGTQEWLSENLAETRYQNNDVIVEVTDGAAWEVLITGARCVYDNNINDIAPTGWHVAEWTELSNLEISLTIAALKKAGIEHWLTNNGTDNFGFHLLGSGYRNDVGGFGGIKVQSSIWASTSWYDSPVFWTVFDGLTSGWSIGNNNGCSVRCVKDSTTLSIGQTGIVVDYDGNIYATVCMPDGKEWMKKNLKVTNYNDGTPIPIITDSTDWANDVGGAMCYYNNNINNA